MQHDKPLFFIVEQNEMTNPKREGNGPFAHSHAAVYWDEHEKQMRLESQVTVYIKVDDAWVTVDGRRRASHGESMAELRRKAEDELPIETEKLKAIARKAASHG